MIWKYNGDIKVSPSISLSFDTTGIKTSIKQPVIPSIPDELIVDPNKNSQYTHGIDSNIFSVAVEKITSYDMHGIKQAILNAHRQRSTLDAEISKVRSELKRYKTKQLWSHILLYGFLAKKFRNNLNQSIANQEQALTILKNGLQNCHVLLDISFVSELKTSYDVLFNGFKLLANSKKIWDITASYANNRFVTRSAASQTVIRTEVPFRIGYLPDIKCELPALIWQNANGADLYFYPSFLIAWNNRDSFAVIGIEELDMNFDYSRFIEEEAVPADAQIIDKTWAKVNKDGSPDRRFRDNYEIPVAKYARISIKTKAGLNEEYMISNHDAADAFVNAFLEYQISVIRLDYLPALTESNKT